MGREREFEPGVKEGRDGRNFVLQDMDGAIFSATEWRVV